MTARWRIASLAWALTTWAALGWAQNGVPLFDDLGSLHHPITTASEQAQRYFDQGLRLVYAFNHEEAIHSFEEAARVDPSAAMAYWGIALALGPNINQGMGKGEERRAVEMVKKAQALAPRANSKEQAYIQALATRYLGQKGAKRKALDMAYADAMRKVTQRFPDDADAWTLFAEALMVLRPWDYWARDGRPQPGTEEILLALETALARNPDHPGACHYYIHAVEASPTPERAISCAQRLPDLMPGAGHLVHMPAHIYVRLGKYRESSDRNAEAVRVDREYLAKRKLRGMYPDGYYAHNVHFLWASLAMEGRSADALKTARDLAAMISPEEARKERWKEPYLSIPLFSLIRFGQWDEMLRETPPPEGLRLMQGLWRLGRGLAHVAQGRLPSAEAEHFVLAGLTKRLGRNRTQEEKTERTLLQIAERVLAGELAARRQRYEEAIRALKEAVRLEDGLRDNEPPLWPLPTRQYLGTVLLMAGKHAEAEREYREDLKKNRENPWGLFGLAQSLRAQHKTDEAASVEERFQAAWARADVTLTASRF